MPIRFIFLIVNVVRGKVSRDIKKRIGYVSPEMHLFYMDECAGIEYRQFRIF